MTREITKRTERKSLFQRGPQAINGEKDPKFHYRYVNDTGARVQNFKEAGYEMVSDTELTVGDSRVLDTSDLGSNKRVVSNDGTVSYLMRIKKEWHAEDQAAKQNHVNETEKAMKQEASSGMFGSIKTS